PDRADKLKSIEAAGSQFLFWQGNPYLHPFIIFEPEVSDISKRTKTKSKRAKPSTGLK
ncbi:hypothetical protein Tco_0021473, partial [Tanacetum coccineum]